MQPVVNQLITLDFETYFDTDLNLNKLNVQEYVANPNFKVWGVGIKIEDQPTEWYGEDEVEDAIHAINWDTTQLVCHNALFDGYVLAEEYGVHPNKYCDTAAMARGLDPHSSASLRDVAKRTFPDDESMRKGDELSSAKGVYDLSEIHGLEDDIAGYCIQDVELTYAIYQELSDKFPYDEQELINITTRLFCKPCLTLDHSRVKDILIDIKACTAEKIEASGVTREILASSNKFAEHIKTNLQLVVPTKRSPTTGQQIPSFGKNDPGWKQLVAMYPQHQHLWDARIATKNRIDETRAARFLSSMNAAGQMPIPLRYYAAHTGRFGGTEKINMQNLPRSSDLRRCLLAPEDKYVYVADLSNIEARMLAYLANEDKLLHAFANNKDVYCDFASRIYNREITKEDKTERFVGKTAVLGLGYGMGADKFAATLAGGGISVSNSFPLEVVREYRRTFSMIPAYWNIGKALLNAMLDRTQFGSNFGPLVVQSRKLIMPNNMALKFPDLEYDHGRGEFTFTAARNNIERTYGGKLVENIVQALSRIVITDAMLRLDKILPDYGGAIVHTVHDEILVVAPKDNPDQILDLLISQMCIAPDWALKIPLAAEGEWGEAYAK